MWTLCCCSICEFSENWYWEGHPFHIGKYEVTCMGVLTSFSVSFSSPEWVTPCSTTIPHLAKVCWHFMSTITAETICNSMGRLLLLYIPKMSLNLHYVPLCNNHSDNIVDQNQEFWRINVGKWHLEEVYIRYCVCGWFFKNRRFEQCLQEKNSYGKDSVLWISANVLVNVAA